jgi:hypothetical protein
MDFDLTITNYNKFIESMNKLEKINDLELELQNYLLIKNKWEIEKNITTPLNFNLFYIKPKTENKLLREIIQKHNNEVYKLHDESFGGTKVVQLIGRGIRKNI